MPSKRFFCTICKKVKRVRKLPSDTIRELYADPKQRLGTCDKHNAIPDEKYNYLRTDRKTGTR